MEKIQVIVLAIIQGVTEFLPISSSAHLILPSELFGWPDQGLAFDVAMHIGSLIAVLIYFRNDLVDLVTAWCVSLKSGRQSPGSRLAWYLVMATIPVGLAGLCFDRLIEMYLRSISVIAATTIFFGLLLAAADRRSVLGKRLEDFNWRSALIVGLAQVLALIPGTSRSGITITAALAMGFDRHSASRFSFLLAIPVIVLSGGHKLLQLTRADSAPWPDIMLGTTLSAITAYLCIHGFLRWINRIGMMPFVWYRLGLGVVLIAIITTRTV